MSDRVLGATQALAGTGLGRVKLAALRARLRGVDRDDVDRALVELQRGNKIVLYREDNPRALTPADREAELLVGGHPRHLVYVLPPVNKRPPEVEAAIARGALPDERQQRETRERLGLRPGSPSGKSGPRPLPPHVDFRALRVGDKVTIFSRGETEGDHAVVTAIVGEPLMYGGKADFPSVRFATGDQQGFERYIQDPKRMYPGWLEPRTGWKAWK